MKNCEKTADRTARSKQKTEATSIGLKYIVSKHLNKIIVICCLGGLGILTTSCVPAYVETTPAAVVDVRPTQPSNLYIWIEGDWYWSNQRRTYVQHNGYWSLPRNGRTYQKGYWHSTPRGQQWKKGEWKRNPSKGKGDNRHR